MTTPATPPTGPPVPPPDLPGMRSASRALRALLPVWGAVYVAFDVLYVAFGAALRTFFEEFDPADETPEIPAALVAVSVVAQVLSFAVLAAFVVWAIWLSRANRVAASAGLPQRRSSALAAASLFIPLLNLWWPWQSMRDLVPGGHPAGRAVDWWWGCYLAASFGVFLPLLGGLVGVVPGVLGAAVAAVPAVGVVVAGRRAVAGVLAVHEAPVA